MNDIVGWVGQMEDREIIEKLRAELAKAENDIRVLLSGESHQVMCLKAEVTACHAAKAVMQQEIDHLEVGLSEAREQVKNLLRLNQLRHDQEKVTDLPAVGKAVLAGPAK